jgi:hypothetical protein
MVQIQLEHDIILAGQLKGAVTILQLSTCNILGVLNKGVVNLPRELTEEPPEDPKKKERVNKLVKAQTLARKVYDYKKYQTKQSDWDVRLAQSEVGK